MVFQGRIPRGFRPFRSREILGSAYSDAVFVSVP